MKIFTAPQIQQSIDLVTDLPILMEGQRQAFIDFSKGQITVPLPLQLSFPEAHGDCHVKAGFRERDDIFIIKVATGFYQNAAQGLPSGDGVILVFSKKTGLLQAILCDEGFLTTLRTALAAAVAARLTPWPIQSIGIVGTGQVANLILTFLKQLYPKAHVKIWGRSEEKATAVACLHQGVEVGSTIRDLMSQGGLIITTTASTKPLILASDIVGKTHIIAMGADDVHKQECDPLIWEMADTVIVDSTAQAHKFGDTFHALQDQRITSDRLIELGKALIAPPPATSNLMVTDLTGIAAQDIAIASFVMEKLGDIGNST